mmetsp:Transcript_3088/g.6818  ORF Transcript_3088/g.6818 Transcript_3088/m.6818 type:complete len:217 (-) Transcript_3088:153-803(-)
MLVLGGGDGRQGLDNVVLLDVDASEWRVMKAATSHTAKAATLAREGATACLVRGGSAILYWGGYNGRYLNDLLAIGLKPPGDSRPFIPPLRSDAGPDAVAAHYRQQIKCLQDAHAAEVGRLRADKGRALLELERLRGEHATVRAQLAQLQAAYVGGGGQATSDGVGWVDMAVSMLSSSWQRWFRPTASLLSSQPGALRAAHPRESAFHATLGDDIV